MRQNQGFQRFGHYYVEGVGYATIQDVLLGGLVTAPLLGLLFVCKLTATSLRPIRLRSVCDHIPRSTVIRKLHRHAYRLPETTPTETGKYARRLQLLSDDRQIGVRAEKQNGGW